MTSASTPLGQRLLHLDRVTSTQDVAAQFLNDPSLHGLIVRTEEQTAGRGRRGGIWLAPPGGCLMFSVLLFPPEQLRRPAPLTIMAGVAVCETLHGATANLPVLKWPNDVLLSGKKVCGILVETRGPAVLVGVGLNVNIPPSFFQLANLGNASSLLAQTGVTWNVEPLFQTLVRYLDSGYQMLLRNDTSGLEEKWRTYSNLINQEIAAETPCGPVRGCIRKLSLESVEIESVCGQIHYLAPESLLRVTNADEEPKHS